jgi:hypothetical protein
MPQPRASFFYQFFTQANKFYLIPRSSPRKAENERSVQLANIYEILIYGVTRHFKK